MRLAESMSYTAWRQTWPQFIVHTQTDTAVDYLERYYGSLEDGGPRYTGSRFEAVAALNTHPDTLGPADFVAVSMLSVDVPAQAAIRLLGRAAATVTELLQRIPADVDIVDADPTLLGADSPAGQLWELLRRPRDGLGPTTTSKLLAAKRPRLLPIWDTFVEQATGLATIGYWAKFQYVLADDNRRLWNWLGEVRSQAPDLSATVSELRVLDVLLWMSVAASEDSSVGIPPPRSTLESLSGAGQQRPLRPTPTEDRDLAEPQAECAGLVVGESEDCPTVLTMAAVEAGPDDG